MRNESFSERLQILRDERKLTQIDMDGMLNVKRQTYGNYEKENGSRPGFDMLIELAQFFSVTTDYILGISDIRNHDGKEQHNTDNLFCLLMPNLYPVVSEMCPKHEKSLQSIS